MSNKKTTVEKERVICQNCRYQYSFLYDAREPVVNALPSMDGDLKNYIDPRESFRACPHCGYHQDWMISSRRWYKQVNMMLGGMLAGCAIVLFLVYHLIMAGRGGVVAAEALLPVKPILAGSLGIIVAAVAAYFGYLRIIWNPNKDVDTESYEAAVPMQVCPNDVLSSVTQYEAATKVSAEVELPRRKVSNPWTALSTGKKVAALFGVILGLLCISVPTLSADLAFNLAKRGMTMLPFYLGLVLFISAAIGCSWQYIDQRMK